MNVLTRRYRCFLGSIALLHSLLSYNAWSLVTNNKYVAEDQKEYLMDKSKLDATCKEKDLVKFKTLADEIAGKWLVRSRPIYFQIMSDVCSDLVNQDFGRANYDAAQKLDEHFASEALQQAHPLEMPFAKQAFFVVQFSSTPNQHNEANFDWVAVRHRRVEQLLTVWQQLHQIADQKIQSNPMLPSIPRQYLDAKKYSGQFITLTGDRVDPDYITNPEVRTQYKVALDKYDKQRSATVQQSDAQYTFSWFRTIARRNIISFYSDTPLDLDELRQLLIKYNIDISDRKFILTQTKKT